jgi:hypothetical protein
LDYWPDGVRRSYELSAFVDADRTIKYEVCADGSLEPSIEKIVIYTNQYGGVEHVARQLPDGKWTSKIGDHEDIVHNTPASLGGSTDYGEPRCFMSRPHGKSPVIRPKENKKEKEEDSSSTSSSASAAVAHPPSASNPRHREDFNSLLNAAARKREPKD